MQCKASNNWINYRLLGKKYTDYEEISHDIQRLSVLSKYNLKRGSNSETSKSITFVCSCNSRKIMEPLENENLGKYGSIIRRQVPYIPQYRGRPSKKKQVKRFNIDACNFRIRFKFNKKQNLIEFVKESYNPHNHPPCEKETLEVSKLNLDIFLTNYLTPFEIIVTTKFIFNNYFKLIN